MKKGKEGNGDLSKEKPMSIEDWKKIDPTGKKLAEALDRAVERESMQSRCVLTGNVGKEGYE